MSHLGEPAPNLERRQFAHASDDPTEGASSTPPARKLGPGPLDIKWAKFARATGVPLRRIRTYCEAMEPLIWSINRVST